MHIQNHKPAAHVELYLASGRNITLSGTSREMLKQLKKLRAMTRGHFLRESSDVPLFLDFGDVLLAPGTVISAEFVPEHIHADDGTILLVENET